MGSSRLLPALAPGRALCWAVALVLLAGAGSPRFYKNEAMRVRAFEPPPGWELAPQSSYTRLLASYAHREGGRLTLTAQRLAVPTTALTLAREAERPLGRQGYAGIRVTTEGDRARLEASLDGGTRAVRQLYVVEEGIGYVVTLIAPAGSAKLLGDFDDAVRSLALGGPTPDAGAPR